MANIKITDLTAYTDPLNTDVLPIVDVTSDTTKKVSIADLLKNAGSGTATAPGIAFDGDSDTGIYRPGADQLAISTNGTGRLFITSDGKVGAGTGAPSGNLDVRGLSGTTIIRAVGVDTNGNADVEIFSTGTTGNSRLFFADTAAQSGSIIYSHSDNSFAFATNGGGECARITSDAKLLVGTPTSTSTGNGYTPALQVAAQSGSISASSYRSDEYGGIVALQKSRTATVGTQTLVSNNDQLGLLSFEGSDGTNFKVAAQIQGYVDGTPGTNDMPGRLVFSSTADGASTPTERMRLRQDGSLLINNTSGTVNATSFGTRIGGTGTTAGFFTTARNVGTGGDVVSVFGQSGQFIVKGDGDCENTNNRYTAISDIKLKQNIEDAASQWDDIKAVQVRKYELIAHPERRHIGVVAQELEQVCPGLVIERLNEETNETYKSVAYSVLYMKAVKALQEAMERIEVLEQRLTDAGIA